MLLKSQDTVLEHLHFTEICYWMYHCSWVDHQKQTHTKLICQQIESLRGYLLFNRRTGAQNCLWHSTFAFLSPNIAHFLASLHSFLGHFTGAVILWSLRILLLTISHSVMSFPLLAHESSFIAHFPHDFFWIFCFLTNFFFVFTDLPPFYIVLLNLRVVVVRYILFLKNESHVSCFSFVDKYNIRYSAPHYIQLISVTLGKKMRK